MDLQRGGVGARAVAQHDALGAGGGGGHRLEDVDRGAEGVGEQRQEGVADRVGPGIRPVLHRAVEDGRLG